MPGVIERFFQKIEVKDDGCWVWTAAISDTGYGIFWNGEKLEGAHRWSYKMHVADIEDGMDICHRCDNRACVNPDHLFQGTRQDNMTDAARKGRMPKGEKSVRSKLKESDIIAIRNDPRTLRAIGDDYGVANQTVYEIKSRKIWKHI